MSTDLDLPALVGSRICHDLVSPLGAIGNGIELLELSEDRPKDGPEMELINESIANANARLRFFRVAYGGGDASALVARSEILATLAAAARGGRLGYRWEIPEDTSRGEARIGFLLIQCLETAMPWGGTITFRRHVSPRGGARVWQVDAEADRMKLREDLWGSLASGAPVPSLTASDVQFALLPQALASIGRRIELEFGDGTITARF